MFQNVERYIDFITKNKLTQAQFLMLYLVYRKKIACINRYKESFPTTDGSMIGDANKLDLIKRGFLVKVGEGTSNNDYEITEKFTDLFYKDITNAANQVWDLYPGFIKINGINTPLTNMDKFRFANIYGERIDYSIDEHKEVVKDVQFGRANDLLRTNIEKFVTSEGWLKLRSVRLQQQSIQSISGEKDLASEF